ncbi:iron-siderophore ABC transporter substrate-binding protein [Microbacterium indicum]|uniref:iron-siderophore ABC transporter substrate-binding protein n=1 Tax=Microbacterium indicum TaxID=358100 RepID=UPI00041CCA32|nr:iron-siderophore ABC transporter substrate-binding protein [Microbacterium indicum]
MRRLTSLLAVSAALSLALAGCAASDGGTAAETPDASGGEGAVVETKFGDIEVPDSPERIVALGWGDAETVLALGGQPVGASDWLGFGGDGVGPWADGLYDESPVIIDTLEPDYEQIAALEPDLILDVKSSGDQDRYDRLSSIATTVGVPEGGDSYLTSQDDQLRMIAEALGQTDQADKLSADIDDAFASARDAHPEWDGLTSVAATRSSSGWGAYVDGAERVEFLKRLGFVQSPEIAALPAGSSGFSVDVSSEQLDVFDADLIVAFPIWIETTEITDDPQWQAIPAVAEGHSVVLDGDISSAYSLGSPLSTQYAVEQVVPLLEDALS